MRKRWIYKEDWIYAVSVILLILIFFVVCYFLSDGKIFGFSDFTIPVAQVVLDSKIMNLEASFDDSLIHYYDFKGSSEDLIGDNDGDNNGVVFIEDKYSESYSAAYFGDGNFTKLSDSLYKNNPQITISAWVRAPAGRYASWSSDNEFYSEGWTYNPFQVDKNRGESFQIGKYGDRIQLFFRNKYGGAYNYKGKLVAFDNQWHYVTYTDDNGVARVYVDGVKESENFSYDKELVLEGTGITRANNFIIGVNFNGAIDDFKIWDRVLSDEEVADEYSNTKPTELPLGPDRFCGNWSVCDASSDDGAGFQSRECYLQKKGFFSTFFNLDSREYYNQTRVCSETSNLVCVDDFRVCPDGNSVYRDPNNGCKFNVCEDFNSKTCGDWGKCYLKFELENSTSSPSWRPQSRNFSGERSRTCNYEDYIPQINDVVCNNYEGSYSNAPEFAYYKFDDNTLNSLPGYAAFSEGVVSGEDRFGNPQGAYYFYNAGDRITTDAHYYRDNKVLTLSAWVKAASAPSQWRSDYRLYNEQTPSGGYPVFQIGKSRDKVQIFIRFDDGSGAPSMIGSSTAFDNQWHKITYVDDNGNVRLYVDGKFDSNFTYVRKSVARISGQSSLGDNFDGAIDDFKIWNYALSEDEILNDYCQFNVKNIVEKQVQKCNPGENFSFTAYDDSINIYDSEGRFVSGNALSEDRLNNVGLS